MHQEAKSSGGQGQHDKENGDQEGAGQVAGPEIETIEKFAHNRHRSGAA
jgi:hypothetical protein